jgi:two-component system, chemotaxis family, chemotaxis protein CheY
MASERADLRNLRVLVVSAKPHVVQLLRQVLGIAGVTDIEVAEDGPAAIALLRQQMFDAALCDEAAAQGDFGHDARRAPGLLDPMMPIFLVCAGPRRRDVERARDKGYTNVLTRPVSAATIARKLHLAVTRPRPFIVAPEFFGPDRRVEARSQARRNDRRKRQPKKIKVAAPSQGEFVEV